MGDVTHYVGDQCPGGHYEETTMSDLRVALLMDVARAARDFLDRPPPTRRDDLVDALTRLDADLIGDADG